MDSLNDPNGSNILDKEPAELLKKYYEELSKINQELKSQLAKSQGSNELLLKEIEKSNEKSPTILTTAIDTMPTETQKFIGNFAHEIGSKTEQLKNINKAIISKFEEDSARRRKLLYEMLMKDEVDLRPYHDVEAATKELQQKMEHILTKCKEEKQKFLELLKKREQDFTQLNRDIADLEPIEKEMKLESQNVRIKLDEKLKSLNLKATTEATPESLEATELLKVISNLKAQLNIK